MSTPAVTDPELYALAEQAGQALRTAGLRIVTAESCTAGWIAKALTDVPGSSQWVECGYVTYSDAAKMRDLGVAAATLKTHGAVSEAVVLEMAQGALRVSGAELAVAVSGIAGPDGGTSDKPVGTVWFAVAVRSRPAPLSGVQHFAGDRDAVRRHTVVHALQQVLTALGGAVPGTP
jgi:nicotinamide-nucleotide amidase